MNRVASQLRILIAKLHPLIKTYMYRTAQRIYPKKKMPPKMVRNRTIAKPIDTPIKSGGVTLAVVKGLDRLGKGYQPTEKKSL